MCLGPLIHAFPIAKWEPLHGIAADLARVIGAQLCGNGVANVRGEKLHLLEVIHHIFVLVLMEAFLQTLHDGCMGADSTDMFAYRL